MAKQFLLPLTEEGELQKRIGSRLIMKKNPNPTVDTHYGKVSVWRIVGAFAKPDSIRIEPVLRRFHKALAKGNPLAMRVAGVIGNG